MSRQPPAPGLQPPGVHEMFAAAVKLQVAKRFADAHKLYAQILKQNPDHPGALQNTALILVQAARFAEAEDLYKRAVAAGVDTAGLHFSRSLPLHKLQRYADALASVDRALALDPNLADAWGERSQLQFDMGDAEGAEQSAKRALQLGPGRVDLKLSLVRIQTVLSASDPIEMARTTISAMRDFTKDLKRRTRIADSDPDRTIRLGFVSPDFRDHPVGRFLLGLAETIDQARIELHGFSSTATHDDTTRQLRARFTRWHEVTMFGDEALADRIREAEIDVLVDLSGHTKGDRLRVFAQKPAPVSFTWLGYFATTGVKAIDYVLGNAWVLPQGEEAQWAEAPWRMPATYLCYSVPEGAPAVAPLPAAAAGRITFGSFNNLRKISAATIEAWSALLAEVPNARLILRSSIKTSAEFVEALRRKFEAAGVAAERLRVDPILSDYAAHLRGYQEIDIALDTFPYNGGTTTVEALYMGVPVLVMKGDRYVAHMGESILHNAGLADWIAADKAEFVGLGARMAADIESLAALRAGLRPRLLASPLFDAPRFARDFEAAVRGMWQARRASR